METVETFSVSNTLHFKFLFPDPS